MTPRERFCQTMRYGRPDHVPWLEEGLRDDVLERWRQQGLAADADLASLFGYDRRERIELDLGPLPRMKSPLSAADLPSLSNHLDADNPRRFPSDWAQRIQRWRGRDHILELPLAHGLFLTLGVHDWSSLEQVLYMLGETPQVAAEILRLHGELAAQLADRVLSEIEVDFASFAEPIGGNNGPMVSPRMYRDLVLSSYLPVIEVLRRHGVQTIAFVNYANARALVPEVLAAGFNCLWAIETEPQAMDYLELRREFGQHLRLIGGIDLDVLMEDEASIEREMRRVIPPLLEEGGYIPLADGRVRPNVPLDSYRAYRRLLAELTGGPLNDP